MPREVAPKTFKVFTRLELADGLAYEELCRERHRGVADMTRHLILAELEFQARTASPEVAKQEGTP